MGEESPSGRRRRGFGAPLAAAALLGTFAFLAWSAARTKGPTFDETAHLAAGISYVQVRDFRMNPEHPALPKLLAGWSAVCAGASCDSSTVAWRRSEQWDFARETLWREGAPWRRVLDAGRAPMLAVGVALGAAVWVWARAMVGAGGAFVALVLYAFCPNFLAHAPLVTTDVPLAFAVVGTAACLWGAHRTGRFRWIASAALFFALSMGTKFSAFSYTPVWLLLAAWPSPARPLRAGLLHAAAFAALGFVCTEALVWAAYGGTGAWTSIADLGTHGRGVDVETMGILRRIPYEAIARVPWPSEDFARGFKDILLYTEAGHPVYLLGMRRDSGWWWAPFVALTAKATLPFLIAAGGGAVLAFRSRRLRRADLAYLVLPAALCLATNVAANLGIGVRHLLPMFPFLMILAAWPLRGGGFPGGIGALALLAALLAWHAGAGAKAHPDYIAYFNEAAGGSRGGYRLLGDSNLDWGQDLPAAAARLRELGVRSAILCYFGTMNPFALDMEWQLLPPAQREKRFDPWIVCPTEGPLWLAMSATNRQGIYSRGARGDANAPPYPWLEGIAPREVLGGTLFLYEIAGEPEALRGLVSTSLRHGLRDEAYAALVRWIALAPEDPEAQRMMSEARASGRGSAGAADSAAAAGSAGASAADSGAVP